ncbi:Aminoacylase [Phytophthora megakarya]|uniref:Aminoacylase n=1 Tax=Phytophthora megakarya TaxID=4795 RepID=A0A225VIT1_9STRA|nr:Aminoacylase [Phytophthora megakarya]
MTGAFTAGNSRCGACTCQYRYVEAVHPGFKPACNIYANSLSNVASVAMPLNELLANPSYSFTACYSKYYVKAEGPTGHSRFIKDTTTMKIIDICNKALAFGDEQEMHSVLTTGVAW